MKKLSLTLIIVLVATLLSLLGAFLWYRSALSPVSAKPEARRLVINKGASAQQIANKLESERLIKSNFAFKLYLQQKGLTKNIPTGEFQVPQNLSTPEVVTLLLKGPTEIWVTIPEGLRREEIALKLAQTFAQVPAEVSTWEQEFLSLTRGREGFLFPDTYLFPKDATPARVYETLTTTLDSKFTQTSTNLSLNQVVTLASLIERETLTAQERPIVAGILMNRLNSDWPLQVDATVQYALGKPGSWWPQDLTRDAIENNASPYNTYANIGLPPGPIANPGLTSLEAADNPTLSEYYFYIHDSSGQIHYARTLDEHNQNVQKYLR